MSGLDPLKSVISIGNVDDTSLALPSGNRSRSGQQRVLEQVQTIQRTRNRQTSSSRSGSTSQSPTSPSYDSVFLDGLKSHSSPPHAGVFGNGFSQSFGFEKSIHRQTGSRGPSMKSSTAASSYQYERGYIPNMAASSYQYERGYIPNMAAARTSTSRSEPDLAWTRSGPKRSTTQQRNFSSKNTYVTQRSNSQFMTSCPPPKLPPPKIANGQSKANGNANGKANGKANGNANGNANGKANGKVNGNANGQSKANGNANGKANGQSKANGQFICSQTNMSKTASKAALTSKSKVDSGSSGTSGVSDLTMEAAVEYLTNEEETFQHCGASYIQHNTYIDDRAKDEVLRLNGVLPLVNLLRSSNQKVSSTASAALRNLSFRSDRNKEEIHRCDGIPEAVTLLRDSDSLEIHKQLTGLLWNLSSAEDLKPDLVKTALPVLVERVILPYATGSTSSNDQYPDVFYNATGCLRNLSSAKQSNRQTMRKCRGLIDSLVGYVKDCVEAGRPDDKSVENCVCILHNLTFQLEAEAPTLFSRISALSRTFNRTQINNSSSSVGCFSPQSSRASEQELHFDFPVVEDQQPNGAGWLIHSKTLQIYLALIGSSKREETQEACCGALQNLTAHEGIVSNAMSQTIVQKLNGLQVLSPLIRTRKVNLQKSILSLMGNLTKNPNLHSAISRKALPELLELLSEGTSAGNESDDSLALACQTCSRLVLKEPDMTKSLISSSLVKSLSSLSNNKYFPKSSKMAALLLYKLWSDKDLQNFMKKQGLNKSSFINDVTMAAQRSVQVVD